MSSWLDKIRGRFVVDRLPAGGKAVDGLLQFLPRNTLKRVLLVGARRKRGNLHGVSQCVVEITVVIELEPFVSGIPDWEVRVLVV